MTANYLRRAVVTQGGGLRLLLHWICNGESSNSPL